MPICLDRVFSVSFHIHRNINIGCSQSLELIPDQSALADFPAIFYFLFHASITLKCGSDVWQQACVLLAHIAFKRSHQSSLIALHTRYFYQKRDYC